MKIILVVGILIMVASIAVLGTYAYEVIGNLVLVPVITFAIAVGISWIAIEVLVANLELKKKKGQDAS